MRLFLAAISLLIAGCSTSPPPAPEHLESAAAPVTVFRPDFGDDDPFDWPARTPARYAVHGIDLSRWQPPVDWATARRSGVSFAFIKATEGGDILDPAFAAHRRAAMAAGVPTSAYHFFYWCTPAATQARWYIENVPRVRGQLPPILDVEWTPFSPTCTDRPSAATVRREIATFQRIVGAHYGTRPLIYTTIGFWEDNGLDRLGGEEFWLRSTAGHPSDTYPAGARWSFWQYSGTGRVPGVTGQVDLNAFAGSVGAWSDCRQRRQQ